MPKFVFAFHGGKQFESREEGAQHMQNWQAWSKGLGDAMIDPGMPVGSSKTVSQRGVADNGGANPISGITIVEADTMEVALEMAQACPHVTIGGSIEVAEAMPMPM